MQLLCDCVTISKSFVYVWLFQKNWKVVTFLSHQNVDFVQSSLDFGVFFEIFAKITYKNGSSYFAQIVYAC